MSGPEQRRSIRVMGWALLTLAAACGSSEYTPPVAPPPRTAASVVPPPTTGPSPLHGFDPKAYYDKQPLSVQRGAASYYHDRFAGRLTANGERYDPNAYTAAHRKLPFGTVLRVVHEKTGDWVLVRVNDRGPYGPGKRIVDLSREAARRLSMLRDGVVRVRIEVLELGEGKYVRKQITRAETSR